MHRQNYFPSFWKISEIGLDKSGDLYDSTCMRDNNHSSEKGETMTTATKTRHTFVTDCDYCGNISLCFEDAGMGTCCSRCEEKQDTEDIHWLRFNEHEDEAQDTGRAFQVTGSNEVSVWSTFRGYPESEVYSRQTMTKAEARKLWLGLLEMPSYDDQHCYTHEGTYPRQCGE